MNKETFRDFDNVEKNVRVNYQLARQFQTVDFVKAMHKKYSEFDMKLDIWYIFDQLNHLIDVSDPDISHPNLYHAFQTAEMIRKDNHPEWLQVVGLIHDLGKIMYLKGDNNLGCGKEKQWAMVGDTFIVGCKIPDTIVFPEFNKDNLDATDNRYNTTLGMYESNCGLDQVLCSWGHDEYLYQILSSEKNKHTLPDEALYIIRFHSLYLHHDKNSYYQLLSKKDEENLKWLHIFNKYDLYSKSDEEIDINKLKPYYQLLLNKYFKNSFLFI